MGQLINGKWGEDQAPQPGPHHHYLGSSEFPFNAASDNGRYHLYVSTSCPFAHRAHIARALKKLDGTIGVSFVNPVSGDQGWQFNVTPGYEGKVGDKLLGKEWLHEVYSAADPNYTGRVTVPLLVDTKPGNHSAGGSGPIRIVSNESIEIVESFGKVGTEGPDFSAHAEEQKVVNELTGKFPAGVFRFGSLASQQDYDSAIDNLYSVIEQIDSLLAKHDYLTGETPTASDVLAFPFFVRFDSAHALLFQITRARLTDYKHIDDFLRRFIALPGVKDTVVLEDIVKATFSPAFVARVTANRKPIIPAVPQLGWYKQ